MLNCKDQDRKRMFENTPFMLFRYRLVILVMIVSIDFSQGIIAIDMMRAVANMFCDSYNYMEMMQLVSYDSFVLLC